MVEWHQKGNSLCCSCWSTNKNNNGYVVECSDNDYHCVRGRLQHPRDDKNNKGGKYPQQQQQLQKQRCHPRWTVVPSRTTVILSLTLTTVLLVLVSSLHLTQQFSFYLHQKKRDLERSEIPSVTTTTYSSNEAATTITTASTAKSEQRSDLTAIVLTTRSIDDCLVMRLQHLIDTAQRDVYLMHSYNHHQHQIINSDDNNNKNSSNQNSNHGTILEKEVNDNSYQLIQKYNITGLKGIIPQSPLSGAIPSFDSEKSGTSKSSFVQFVVNQTKYEWVWHLEDDVLFTGPWSDVFRKEPEIPWQQRIARNNSSSSSKSDRDKYYDVIATGRDSNDNWKWHQADMCQMKVASGDSVPCRNITRYYVRWSILRLSRRMAQSLLRDLQLGSVKGHHEAVIGPYSQWHNYSIQHIHKPNIGSLSSPGSLRGPEQSLYRFDSQGKLQPNQLYHPVKCKAHRKEKDMAFLRRWLIH